MRGFELTRQPNPPVSALGGIMTGRAGKTRNIVLVWLVWPLITLGIYHLVWWYKINKELKAYGEAKGYDLGQNPTNSVLALFPGGIIVIPAGTPHWFKQVPTSISYFVVKVLKP